MIWYPEVQTLDQIPAFHAARRPQAPALVGQGRVTTYLELEQASGATAQVLRAAGVAPGDRVAYLGKESKNYYVLLFGCAKAGAVLVPVNWRLTAVEVGHILRDSGTVLLFVEEAFGTVAKAAAAALPEPPETVALEEFESWRGEGGFGAVEPRRFFADDEVAQIYTSGTTGLPKGVVLAHRSFFAVRDALGGAGLDWIDWRDGDVSLIAVPGFHIGGLWWAVQGLAAGVENIVLPAFTPAGALDAIRTYGVTTTCLVPSMIRMLLAEAGVTREDFATLRKIAYGGSPISTDLLAQCVERIGCELAQLYGLTETGNTAVCLPPGEHIAGTERLLAAGRPYPGFGAKVVGPDGGELAAGESGEICLRTPGHMIGYWGLAEATADTLRDGWIHTGDAGYLDADGFVYVRDRIKDTVIIAGENVFPAEVEAALAAHPAVVDAAVVGRPDERWGEALHAFVVLGDGAAVTPRELILFLRGRLADFKIPAGFEFVAELPRNPSGKILRRELRQRFWAAGERQVN